MILNKKNMEDICVCITMVVSSTFPPSKMKYITDLEAMFVIKIENSNFKLSQMEDTFNVTVALFPFFKYIYTKFANHFYQKT